MSQQACDDGDEVAADDDAGADEGSHAYLELGTYTVTVTVTDKDGGVDSDDLTLTVVAIPMAIDIKPGDFPNSINTRNRGLIPVAVLGGSQPAGVDTVDPTTIIASTIRFEGADIAHR